MPTKIIEDVPLFTIPLLLQTKVQQVKVLSQIPTEIEEGQPFPDPLVISVLDQFGNPMPGKLVIALKAGSRNISYNQHYEIITPGKLKFY